MDVQGMSVTIYPTGNRAFTMYYRAVDRHRPMLGEPRIGTCHGRLQAVMPVDLQLWRARGKQPLQASVRKGPRTPERPLLSSDVDPFGDGECVLEFHAQVPHCAIRFGVTEQKSNGSEVAGLPVNLRDLCPSHGVRAVGTGLEAYGRHPFPD